MFSRVKHLIAVAFAISLSSSLLSAQQADAPKVIIDTDFNTIFDDGQVAVMAAQLYAQGVINLLGFTIASGNQWRDQEVSDCLKAVERLGINNRVKVYVGSQYPLLHDYKSYLYEQRLFGQPIDYVGAYAGPQPNLHQLVPPPDGFATHTLPATEDAVDFMIETIHRYPNEVTILEIAPPTNLALAIRKDPSIVPLIKQVITMAGQMYVSGNAYLDNAEFNWWFDPEATQVVLRAGDSTLHHSVRLHEHSSAHEGYLPSDYSTSATNHNHSVVSTGLCSLLQLWPAAVYPLHLRHYSVRVSR